MRSEKNPVCAAPGLRVGSRHIFDAIMLFCINIRRNGDEEERVFAGGGYETHAEPHKRERGVSFPESRPWLRLKRTEYSTKKH